MYTPVDSLVFGGNFLHGFDCPGQLRTYEVSAVPVEAVDGCRIYRWRTTRPHIAAPNPYAA